MDYLGIDYGAKRIGLATANSAKLATARTTVGTVAELINFIKQHGPFAAVIIGLPRGLDGQDTPQTLAVRRFCDDTLWSKLHLEPIFQDEAGTSTLAEERLKAAGKPYTKADIDAEAAAIILQDYLDGL